MEQEVGSSSCPVFRLLHLRTPRGLSLIPGASSWNSIWKGWGWCQGTCSLFPAAEPEGMDVVDPRQLQKIHPSGIPTAPGVLSLIPAGCWIPILVFGVLGSLCPNSFGVSLIPHSSDPTFPSPSMGMMSPTFG